MKNYIFNQICNKCGDEAMPDEKQSNENWTVYPTQCKCGGRFELSIKVNGEKLGKDIMKMQGVGDK